MTRPINTWADLAAWIKEVEAGTIPPDDVIGQARLAGNALRTLTSAPIEGVDVGRMRGLLEKATPGPWAEDEAGIYAGPGCMVIVCSEMDDDGNEPSEDTLAATGRLIVFLRNNAPALLTLASTLPERVAEAVMGEREACAQVLLNGSFLHEDAPDARWARSAAKAIRSRPAPAHPMAGVRDEAVDLLNALNFRVLGGNLRDADENLREVANLHGRIGKMVARLSAIPSPTPPADDRAVQRVVEAARAAGQALQPFVSEAAHWERFEGVGHPRMESVSFSIGDLRRARDASAQLSAALAILTPGAPDHG